jgi:diguanylate cyclase (GGDEF)-like protein
MAESGRLEQRRADLSAVATTRRERQFAYAALGLSLMAFAVVVPLARIPLLKMPAFIPSFETALIFSDLITAILLFCQFAPLRSRALLALACGYLFDALIIIPHALTFPGAFSETGLLGAGHQTTIWLYIFWHAGFPLFVLAYAMLANRDEASVPAPIRTAKTIAFSVAGVAAIVFALTVLATIGQALLPIIIRDGDYSGLLTTGAVPGSLLVTVLALIAVWRRRRQSVLDLWLVVVVCACFLDLARSVLVLARFDLGWYAGRGFALLASCALLLLFLAQISRLHVRLAKAVATAETRNTELVREHGIRRSAEYSLELSNAALVMRADLLDKLSRMTNRLQLSRSEAELADLFRVLAPEMLNHHRGKLYLMSHAKNILVQAAAWSAPMTSMPEFAPEECCGVRSGRFHYWSGQDGDVACQHVTTAGLSAYVCLPLVAQGETVGLIYLEGIRQGAARLEPGQLSHLQVFAENVALTLINIRLRETLRDEAIRDPLTGIFNRRYLKEALEIDLARAGRSKGSLACIMIDVDHFKWFNDSFGHDAGDLVLKQFAEKLTTLCRKGDIACRYGGEEFILVLPGANVEDAATRAEEIREAVKALAVTQQGTMMGQIALSIGVAAYPMHALTAETLIAAADAALLAAKRAGRDRVEIAHTIDEAA